MAIGGGVVVGEIVGDGEAVERRVELDRVVDAGLGQRRVERGGVLLGERGVLLGAPAT